MCYEDLLKKAEKERIIVKSKPLRSSKGRLSHNRIALSASLSTNAERFCILAEELGHYYTTVGNILDQSKPENRRQERRARAWAYEQIIPPKKLVAALKNGCRNFYETADFLGITEEFLLEALSFYEQKYGYWRQQGYVLTFSPLCLYQKQKNGQA